MDVVNISSPQNMQGIEQVTVSNAAIFLGFGYDESLLLVTGNTSSFRNPGVPDFSITGNLTLSTMNIGNVQNPVGIANVTTQIPTTGTYVVQPLETASQTSGSDIFAIVNDPPSTDPAGPSSLWIVDATTPASPVLYPFTTQFGMTDVATAQRLSFGPECEWFDDLQHSGAVTPGLTPDKGRGIVVVHLRRDQVQQLIFFFNVNSNLQPEHLDAGMFQSRRATVG